MSENFTVSQSPGRINIIGEHTDYNNGFVLPAAIDKKSVFKLRKSTGQLVTLTARNIKETFTFDLRNFHPISGGWQNYVMGVVSELQKLRKGIEGFEGEFEGDVPIGSGMSSSAALECSLAYGLNELFSLELDDWQIIKACQMAEHNFVGIKCGIMDQFASVMGKKDRVMLLDCRSLEFEYYPFDLGDYQLVLLNTNVSHTLASSEYNARREECEQGVSILQTHDSKIQSLRDATLLDMETCREKMTTNIYKRCHHIITENTRVLKAAKALSENNLDLLGELMYQSHFSLQKNYRVSCPELDFLIQLTMNKPYIAGGRMMGGGFGGCTINLIKKASATKFIDFATRQYQQQYDLELTPYFVNIEDGAGIISA